MSVHFDPSRFEASIRAFEEEDCAHPSADGAVLFTGSSTITNWRQTLDSDFPGVALVKRGFGGSTYEDLCRLYDRVVSPHRPSKVVLYSGANDMHGGQTADEVFGYFGQVWERLTTDYPEVRIGVIATRPSPVHWHLADGMARLNAAMRDVVTARPGSVWLDANTPMTSGPRGELNPGLFLEDRLHLNAAGYRILIGVVRPFVTE